MPIQTIASRDSAPILGTIRLGVKVKTQNGGERPDNADHFVLHDAPQVEEIYGKQPKELDIVFASDDLEQCVPTWLTWWRPGAKDAKGKAISGILRCKGNGPDEAGNPGVAQYFDKRDLQTGLVPTRPCMAQGCPDWNDAKGNRQCKPGMQIYIILPKVSLKGVFRLSTTSWSTIKSIYDQLKWQQKVSGGKIMGAFFKLVKEQKSFTTYDANGKEQKRPQWVVSIKANEDKLQIAALQQRMAELLEANFRFVAPAQAIESPVDDVPQLTDSGAADATEKVATAEAILADPEVQAYFKRLEQVLGAELSPKDRLIKARKCEGKPDPKKALLDMIADEGKRLAAKVKPAEVAAPVEPTPPPATPVPEAAGGLI